jgi:hypothetical protein
LNESDEFLKSIGLEVFLRDSNFSEFYEIDEENEISLVTIAKDVAEERDLSSSSSEVENPQKWSGLAMNQSTSAGK